MNALTKDVIRNVSHQTDSETRKTEPVDALLPPWSENSGSVQNHKYYERCNASRESKEKSKNSISYSR